jgi:hypothetical protein
MGLCRHKWKIGHDVKLCNNGEQKTCQNRAGESTYLTFWVRESVNFRALLPAIFVQSIGATSGHSESSVVEQTQESEYLDDLRR